MKRDTKFAISTWAALAFCLGVLAETFVVPRLASVWIQLDLRAPVANYLVASELSAFVWHWNGVWSFAPDYLVALILGLLVASMVPGWSLVLAAVAGAGMFVQGAFWTVSVSREGFFPGVLPEVLLRSALVLPAALLGGTMVRLTSRWSGPA